MLYCYANALMQNIAILTQFGFQVVELKNKQTTIDKQANQTVRSFLFRPLPRKQTDGTLRGWMTMCRTMQDFKQRSNVVDQICLYA